MNGLNDLIQNIKNMLVNAFINNFFDWIITVIITYFTVRYATRQYYGKVKVVVVRNIMEQGLRALFNLRYDQVLPETAKVIFVEYKGRCYKPNLKREKLIKDCSFFDKIRKTIAVVGGDTTGVSAYRPRNYGVLGVANILQKPVVYNFRNGVLYKYDNGKFYKLNTSLENDQYVFETEREEKIIISNNDTSRYTMIAFPIEYNKKLVGGITFDICTDENTLYQYIDLNDKPEIKKQKENNNLKVIKEVMRTANSIKDAYFKKKGEDI